MFSPFLIPDDPADFAVALTQLEEAIVQLRQRYEAVQSLRTEQQQVEQQLQLPPLSPDTVTELQQRLQTLETQLESQLFDWRSLQEPFWQAVRFGGLGIILGWLLHSLVSR